MNDIILQCANLTKSYSQENNSQIEILRDINLLIHNKQTISIVGSSGSGKSTLLHLLAGLNKPTSGMVIVDGLDLATLNDKNLCILRNKVIGFIYQFHHLLPEFTALENVLIPLIIANKSNKDYALYILNKLNLTKQVNHYPNQLSGGEKQRVAVARAVINKPKIILADEPTGNLDNFTAHQVFDIFLDLQQELNTSLIMVTHDIEIANRTNKIFHLQNKKLLPREL